MSVFIHNIAVGTANQKNGQCITVYKSQCIKVSV